jgi:hypothetical protein
MHFKHSPDLVGTNVPQTGYLESADIKKYNLHTLSRNLHIAQKLVIKEASIQMEFMMGKNTHKKQRRIRKILFTFI